jgi:hypothetical protein
MARRIQFLVFLDRLRRRHGHCQMGSDWLDRGKELGGLRMCGGVGDRGSGMEGRSINLV